MGSIIGFSVVATIGVDVEISKGFCVVISGAGVGTITPKLLNINLFELKTKNWFTVVFYLYLWRIQVDNEGQVLILIQAL